MAEEIPHAFIHPDTELAVKYVIGMFPEKSRDQKVIEVLKRLRGKGNPNEIRKLIEEHTQ